MMYKKLRGCLLFVVGLLILYLLTLPSREAGHGLPTVAVLPSATRTAEWVAAAATNTVSLVTIIPTVVIDPGGVATATITDTPAVTSDVPTQPPATVQVVESEMYTTTRDARARQCASTTCEHLGTVGAGTSVVVTGAIEGEEVTAGIRLWYQVQYGGQVAYIYSPLLVKGAARVVPTVNQPPIVTAAPAGNGVQPGNCSTAVAMGLSPAQAAAAGLDRDHDGVACYGT